MLSVIAGQDKCAMYYVFKAIPMQNLLQELFDIVTRTRIVASKSLSSHSAEPLDARALWSQVAPRRFELSFSCFVRLSPFGDVYVFTQSPLDLVLHHEPLSLRGKISATHIIAARLKCCRTALTLVF